MIPNRENGNNSVSIKNIVEKVVFVILIAAITRLVISKYNGDELEEVVDKNETTSEEIFGNKVATNTSESPQEQELQRVEKVVVKQPSCPKSYLLVILEEICTDLVVKKELCTPEDIHDRRKHKMPRTSAKNQSNTEPEVPAIINYVMGGLLITSVGAALVELYKAKKQSPKKNGKNPLSRKCSLADLTVMKHQRKELIRRDSIMEVPEESGAAKQLGFIPPPLYRRCSFPVGPNINSVHSYTITDRRTSVDPTKAISVVDSRRTSIVDSRRQSILTDSRRTSIDCRNAPTTDGRRISVDDSPERRHHRLVHRH